VIRTRLPALHAALVGLLIAAGFLLTAAPVAAAESDTVYSLLNDARWADGKRGVVRNAALDRVAADWASKLAAAGTLSHNPAYASQIPAGWTSAGENVAQGHPDAGSMHAGWMASPGHRANILGSYTDVGIAFLSAGGTTWGVQVFAAYPGHVGPAAPAAGAVSGSQVAESPAPGESPRAEVSTAEPTLAPSPETTDATEAVAVGQEPDAGSPARWWIAVLAGVVALAGATFWWMRRRRITS
jgi:hypothetical protein